MVLFQELGQPAAALLDQGPVLASQFQGVVGANSPGVAGGSPALPQMSHSGQMQRSRLWAAASGSPSHTSQLSRIPFLEMLFRGRFVRQRG